MFRTLCILISALLSLSVYGQGEGSTSENIRSQFTVLDWNELRIDSLLPVYSEVVPLETDYRQHTYSVALEYPEYGPLTKREVEVVARFDSLIGEEIRIESHVGVLRREGMLDIAFVPIVRRNGHYEKLLSARVMITAELKPTARRAAPERGERYAAHSQLAEGRWVKISITDDGMYQLTRSALRKMGFTRPENVHLYGYGGHRQDEVIKADTDYDDLEEVPLYYSQSLDAWLFWGNGLLHWRGNNRILNHYANAAYYFLREESTPSSIETIPSPTGSGYRTYTSFTDHVLYERDEYAWFTGGRHLYEFANIGTTGSRSYRLQTLSSVGNESLTVAFTAGAKTVTEMVTNVNGTNQTKMTLPALTQYTYGTAATNTFNVSSLSTGDTWNIRLTSTAGNDARLDYMALHYTRRLTPHDGYVAFSQTSGTGGIFQTTAPQGHVMMQIGKPGSPAAMLETNYVEGTGLAATVADASRSYVCFDPTYSYPQPVYRGEVANQDLHAMDSLDMVIIIPASGKLWYQAERLAEAHRLFDGLRVAVVRADQVYNEFSSGTPDATAYRRFMKMLYDRASSGGISPRYLLLMGDCAWDNRMLSSAWRNMNPDDYLLCYESDNSLSDTRCYVMEDYFGLLDDGEGGSLLKDKSDIGVGRFPVSSESEARVMVDKSIAYISHRNADAWKNIVNIMGDDGDENEHMRYADDVAKRIATDNPDIEIRKTMWDAYKRVSSIKSNTYPEVTALMKKQQEEGALVMNYTGHGGPNTLSHEFVINLEDFRQFQGSNLPLWVTAACDVMPFDNGLENIGEAAVLNAAGGALAFYGTTRTVYANQNLDMNRYFMHYLFACDDKGERYRLGDAIYLAKNAIITAGLEGGNEENKLHYALLGDPALTIGAPLQKVVLDSINGQLLSETPIPLQAGQKVHLSGHVNDRSQSLLSDFQGVLTMRFFDSERTVTCLNNAGAKVPFEFQDRGTALYTANDSVHNGRFSFDFVVPVDINYSDATGRIVFYAVSNDRQTEASGYNEQFTLGGVSDDLAADTIGPRLYAFLNDENFQNGDVVNSEPFFIAALQDVSGISTSGNGVGHDLSLCIDGRADLTYNLNDYYHADFGDFTRGIVTFSIPSLEAGTHSLTFRAWDVLNNSTTTSLDFVVDSSLKPHIMQLTASPNPATVSTTFIVSHDRPGATCTFTLDVFDFAGRRLYTHTETGSSSSGVYRIPWDLTTQSGGKLGSGVYLCRCQMQCDGSKRVSKTQKIIVINNK